MLAACFLQGFVADSGQNGGVLAAVGRAKVLFRSPRLPILMTDAGLIVIVSFISPFRSERQFARDLMAEGEFIEIFVDTPVEECARRDPKGLYRKAMAGEIQNFTGVTSPYEVPENPEIRLDTIGHDVASLVHQIDEFLARHMAK